ncbi:MAG: signal peptidase II [Bacteroidetes bacterium]|nr:signal peptidase II [Bacteroidota bacterium]
MRKETNWSYRKGFIFTFSIVLLVLILDQSLKVYIKSTFEPGDIQPLFGDWLLLEYIENQGMAFGTSFGSSIWSKLALSIFRVIAIGGIVYFWIKQSKKGAPVIFHLAVAFVLAGATGNLIDSMFYDYLFPYDPCMPFNHLRGSGNTHLCDYMGEVEVKFKGFLLGNVVDMFKFQAYWPSWMPWIAGREVFPAIWNLADGSITLGVIMVFFNQKVFFTKDEEKTSEKTEDTIVEDTL